MSPARDKRAQVGLRLVIVLLMVLAAINVASVFGIVAARRAAESAALDDLRLQTRLHARSLETLLAALHGELVFFAGSSPLARLDELASERDPMSRRMRRLDIEGSLLLFVKAHPEVRWVVVRDHSRPIAVCAYRAGAPVLVPPQSRPADDPNLMRTSFPVGEGGRMEAWIQVDEMVARAAPGDGAEHRLIRTAAEPASDAVGRPDGMTVRTPIRDESWSPPVSWTLVRHQSRSALVESVAALAGRYRVTVALNVLVMGLALVLGMIAYQQARLVAESRRRESVRELERQLVHTERLASVGRLAAGIAHEVNNPLEGMANYLTLLEEDLREGRVVDAAKLAHHVREGLDRIASVVRRVLTLSSAQSSDMTRIDLNQPVRDAIEFVRANPKHRDIAFDTELPSAPLEVDGDAAALGQLFLNLLLNACEWQSGGRVAVRVERDGDRAVASVTDDGPGIDVKARRQLFEPFFSTRGSTGLGLSVCHRIVLEHHGRIRADNNPTGPGAQIIVELPLGAPTNVRNEESRVEST